MHSEIEKLSSTKVKITVTAVEEDLKAHKQAVLTRLSSDVKLDGFRKGTAPASLVEKNVDPNVLQREFLDAAMSALYSQAANNQKIRPVGQPEVEVKKFVPYSVLDFIITVEVVGDIKLADYKKIKLTKPAKLAVTAKDLDEVLKSIRNRMAERQVVDRAAKKSDEVLIDFKGVDDNDKPIPGADGQDFPLILGSGSFIPGFEDNLVGLKAGDEKTFKLTFPKDYNTRALASKKVSFTVKVKEVKEIIEPELSDDLATKVGPFKNVQELKDDVRKQLAQEKQNQQDRDYQNELVAKIVEKSSVEMPDSMVAHQLDHNLQEAKKNLTYRGLTYQEFLEQEGLTDESYVATVLKPQAEQQIKTSLVLSEVAQKENLTVTLEELEVRIQLMKGQYKSDARMQAELAKPENRQDIANRMLMEKVLDLLTKSANS